MTLRHSIRIFALTSVAFTACAATPPQADAQIEPAVTTPVPTQALTQAQRFEAWKARFISEATAKGYDEAFVRGIIMPTQINEKALDRDTSQPEFTKPIWNYVDNAASADRLNRGRAKLSEERDMFNAVEGRYRVDRNILTAIWGLETSYGRIMGTHETISALATFAFEGRRKKFGEQQLYGVLDMLKSGTVRKEQLVGSWAGAMGMTQFIPTTFRDYAVDFDADGNKDLWTNSYDAIGSAAHYLSRSGWRWGEPAFTEVKLSQDFDYSLSDGSKRSVNDWAAKGVTPIGGQAWSDAAKNLEAKLLVPAGSRGPAFLTFKNFDVIKRYNNSTSYALGIGVLAEALKGKPAIRTSWPRSDQPLSLTDKKNLQRRLTQLGYNTGGIDGQIGPNTRKAIRAWQADNGLPADGYVEQSLLRRIMG